MDIQTTPELTSPSAPLQASHSGQAAFAGSDTLEISQSRNHISAGQNANAPYNQAERINQQRLESPQHFVDDFVPEAKATLAHRVKVGKWMKGVGVGVTLLGGIGALSTTAAYVAVAVAASVTATVATALTGGIAGLAALAIIGLLTAYRGSKQAQRNQTTSDNDPKIAAEADRLASAEINHHIDRDRVPDQYGAMIDLGLKEGIQGRDTNLVSPQSRQGKAIAKDVRDAAIGNAVLMLETFGHGFSLDNARSQASDYIASYADQRKSLDTIENCDNREVAQQAVDLAKREVASSFMAVCTADNYEDALQSVVNLRGKISHLRSWNLQNNYLRGEVNAGTEPDHQLVKQSLHHVAQDPNDPNRLAEMVHDLSYHLRAEDHPLQTLMHQFNDLEQSGLLDDFVGIPGGLEAMDKTCKTIFEVMTEVSPQNHWTAAGMHPTEDQFWDCLEIANQVGAQVDAEQQHSSANMNRAFGDAKV